MRVGDLDPAAVNGLLARFGLSVEWVEPGKPIRGSFWGEPEAGLIGRRVFVRPDTPVHSMLHATCHVICMDETRRRALDRDAGGSDIEEAAVCYLQILLADELADIGRDRLMRDMDAWGYSFRLGNTRRWFEEDAEDALSWLRTHGLVTDAGAPAYRLRAG